VYDLIISSLGEDEAVSAKASTIQENGQITLPIEFRRKYGLQKGDAVVFRETEEGLLISTRETLAMKALGEIGEALTAKGITLEEMIESAREGRRPQSKV
jgi:AbrB family looped-hinge helix DNA binding protein